MIKLRNKAYLALLAALVFGAFAIIFSPATQVAAQATARVRVAHLSPDAPAVDVYANGNKVLSNVPFKAVSDYLSVPGGSYNFKVFPAGAPSTGTAVIDATATLEAGKDYTVAATGKVANIKATVLTDDNKQPAAGKARIRVFHASPDAPAVDIAVKGGPVLVPNLAFPNASGYLEVDATSYDLEVRPAGTTTVAFPINGLKLEAGKVYTAIAEGLLGGNPAFTVALQTDATFQAAQATTAAPTTAAAQATTVAGSGSTPNLPSTGAGGAASTSDTFLPLSLMVLGIVLVTGAGLLLVRKERR